MFAHFVCHPLSRFPAPLPPSPATMTLVCIQSLPELTAPRHTEEQTALYLGDTCQGTGTLHIDESQLVWWSAEAGRGYCLAYPSIVCHATCKDTANFPHPCLYCHLDTDGQAEEQGSDEEEEAGQEAEPTVSELRFVPENQAALDAMFQAMSECQALHPDPDEDAMDEEEDMFYTADNIEELEAHLQADQQAARTLRHLEDVFQLPTPQQLDALLQQGQAQAPTYDEGLFEDAEEDQGPAR
eukprot:comp19146_c0_seq1/m.21819 comp19146_c0_seq1/g.21819  ORF comp19146_c0_seq1/g.21819 comp19146_c0_seq1/m.21819 type:complete len:241 (-) comp19146_c0_seq1:270-992(-)